MPWSKQQRPDGNPLRTAAGGAATVAAVALLIAGLIFSNSFAAQLVAADALVLHRAEATLGANDVAVKSLGQAVLLGEDELLGVADSATAAAALTEARFALSELRERTTSLLKETGADPQLAESASEAADLGDKVVALLDGGDVATAGSLLIGEARRQFEAVRDVTR
ncbi:MAG: hypothetical protein KJO07_04960, partial [Deltaproteobacteria bacterium]|nr:hypothetical protein [Deltaproteobacteria bacterium]